MTTPEQEEFVYRLACECMLSTELWISSLFITASTNKKTKKGNRIYTLYKTVYLTDTRELYEEGSLFYFAADITGIVPRRLNQ